MKKIIRMFKDNLYDSIDWIMMGAIIFLVVGFIGWRLDILFAKDKTVDKPTTTTTVTSPENETENNTDATTSEQPTYTNETNSEVDANAENSNAENSNADANATPNPGSESPTPSFPDKTTMDIDVTIPSGSGSDQIAKILLDKGAITSTEDFLKKVNDKGLETKLKAGTFTFPAGSSTNDVIDIISR